MTAVTVDLERVLAAGKKNTYEGRAYADIVSCIARSKRVVCLTGAGISTSAGIPDFRSKDGLYKLASAIEPTLSPAELGTRPTYTRSPSSASASSSSGRSPSSTATSSLKGTDLFSTQVFSSAASLARFYRFMTNLHTLSSSANPTPTHRFIRTLSQKGKLLRAYTQNIDGLEEKVGLTSANPSDCLSTSQHSIPPPRSTLSKGKGKYQGDLVHLHGRAGLVRCTVCTYTGAWTDEVSQAYEAGYSMPCSQCQERLSLRKALGKRLNIAVGSLRPAITLYGEQGMEDLFISEISNTDIRSRPDCLIIFGTSLKVHGFKQLAKDFAREVEENNGKVIYVNFTEPGRDWNSTIDYHVQGHTDVFVEAVLEEWRRIRPQDFQTQTKLSVSDFQPTKDKYSRQLVQEEKQRQCSKGDLGKQIKQAQIATPLSPSKVGSSARRRRYDDDEDFVGPSSKSSRKAQCPSQTPKSSSKSTVLPATPNLPTFKRISSDSIEVVVSTNQKRNAVRTKSCDIDHHSLRMEGKDENGTRNTQPIASSRTATPTYIVSPPKRPRAQSSETSYLSKRRRLESIVSDKDKEGAGSDFDHIPLIAEMDSDDEDTVYVASSRSMIKASPR